MTRRAATPRSRPVGENATAGPPAGTTRPTSGPRTPQAPRSPAKGRLATILSTLKEWLNRRYDLVLPEISRLSIFVAPVASIALWIAQITFGVSLGRLINEYANSRVQFDWQQSLRNSGLILFGLIMLIAYVVTRTTGHRARRTKQLQDALVWFSQDMKFRRKPEQDTRCTIWAPVGRPNSESTVRMRQLVYYEPRMSEVAEEGSPSYRRNGPPGRITRISRHKDGLERPIGILGKTAFESIYNRLPQMYVETIPDGVDFQKRMVENWNFTPAEARVLSQDRRSYLAISIPDQNSSALLGVLYCDSRDPTALNRKVGDKAAKYLPHIARIITSP